jgi:hypothetical protein
MFDSGRCAGDSPVWVWIGRCAAFSLAVSPFFASVRSPETEILRLLRVRHDDGTVIMHSKDTGGVFDWEELTGHVSVRTSFVVVRKVVLRRIGRVRLQRRRSGRGEEVMVRSAFK